MFKKTFVVLQVGKMSKRSKIKMFRKQQEITEGSDDDQEMIIPHHRDSTSSSCASGELSDDNHGQMILTSSTTSKSALITVTDEYDMVDVGNKNLSSEYVNNSFTADTTNEIDSKKFFSQTATVGSATKVEITQHAASSDNTIGKRQVFSDSAVSQQPQHRNRLSVGSSLDISGGLHPSDDVFKERPRSCSYNPSLSRSPAVKRRNDHSIKIAGLATLGTRKFANTLHSSLPFRGSKRISGDKVEHKQGIRIDIIYMVPRNSFSFIT